MPCSPNVKSQPGWHSCWVLFLDGRDRGMYRASRHSEPGARMSTQIEARRRGEGALQLMLCAALLAGSGAHAAGPAAAAAASAPPEHGMALPKKKKPPPAPVKLVDINSASRKELLTLPGIGPAQADRIVACRPFLTKGELVTKKVVTTGPFLSLKNRVVAMPKGKPTAATIAQSDHCRQ
jgi:competence protein ComEA